MAYAIRHTGTSYSVQGDRLDVNIWVDGYVGSAAPINTNSIKITYEGDGESLFDTVMQGSSCAVGIEVTTGSAFDSWLKSLVGSESEVFIEIERNNLREWVGKLIIDTVEIEDMQTYSYTLTASCGLAQLKDYTFDYALDSGNPFTLVLGEVIRLSLLPTFTHELYSSTTDYITSWLNIYEQNQQGWRDLKCPLEINRVNRAGFIKDKENNEAMTNAEVIEAILRPFGARIRMMNGTWQIINPTEFAVTPSRYFKYYNRDYALGPSATSTYTHTTNEGNDIITMSGNTFGYKPAIIRSDVVWKPQSGVSINKDIGVGVIYPFTSITQLDSFPCELAGKLTYLVPRILQNGQSVFNGRVRLTIGITAATDSTNKYQLEFNNAQGFYWTTNLSARVFRDFPNVTDGRVYDVQEISLQIPILVDDTINRLNFEIYINNNAEACSQIIEWASDLTLKQAFLNGTFDDDMQYQSTNNVLTNNSIHKRYEILLGDSDNSLTDLAIKTRVFNTSTWQQSELWSARYDATTSLPIGQILSRNVLQMQRVSNRMYTGSFIVYPNFTTINTIGYDSSVWFFNAGEFDWHEGIVNGEWLALNRVTSNITNNTGPVSNRSDIDRLIGDVGGLRDVVRGHTNDIGVIDTRLFDIENKMAQVQRMLSRVQPSLIDIVRIEDSYTPGSSSPLIANIENGQILITIG
jgi:hypothetical protein